MTQVDSLLPPNATPFLQAIEQSTARLGAVDPSAVSTFWDAQTCPSAYLPYLAWAWSVATWRSDWTDTVKRAVIAAAPTVKRLNGTVASVQAALGALGARIEISEWWQTGAAPYTATVRVYAQGAQGQPQLSEELLEDLASALATSAPARAHVTALFGVEFAAVGLMGAIMAPIEIDRLCATTLQTPAADIELGGAVMTPIEIAYLELAALPGDWA